MESSKIVINSYSLNCYRINTLIIGSGAASLNAAVSLHSKGQEDIIIATTLYGGGTSNNAGSDKQTYYKLSLSGNVPDSIAEMAKDLFNGNCMHGDIALCEAQGSVQAFMNLVALGVKFPHDKYGSWPGYKTDHDSRGRATSAGPYTSKRMFEALSSEVTKRRIRVLDYHHCVAILTDRSGSKVIGALAINTREKDYTKAFVLFNSTNVILGTGGPAGIYETSVYPLSQSGSIGMAFRAGATGQNLTESQFGIASIKFRWNLSGSYQQAIPRYFSTDKHGKGEREFLNEYFSDYRALIKAIFLKGYQWPFDSGKVSKDGSSKIDILVHIEINEKGRMVFIDYTRNPSWSIAETFSTDNLDPEVGDYLRKSNAIQNTPAERLRSLNSPALDLYKEHGIDLASEPLQIAVCAQHNNGGLKANIWWESDLSHLFPVGEVNGSHGVYRPGGSALNSGQVGSYRAAQFISKKYSFPPLDNESFLKEADGIISGTLNLATGWIKSGDPGKNKTYLLEIQKRMSLAGGIIRDKEKTAAAFSEASYLLKKLPGITGARSVAGLTGSFLLLDHCIAHFVYLAAIRLYIENGGRSRGSCIIVKKADKEIPGNTRSVFDPELCVYDKDIEKKIIEVVFKEGKFISNLVDVREIPKQDLWFEKVREDYLEDNYTVS